MVENLLIDITICIIAATLVAYIAKGLKQQLIPAYIISGLIIGPLGLRLITDSTAITHISELGVAFLLFLVGMEINFSKLKSIGNFALFGGTAQLISTFIIGYFFASILGMSNIEAIYIGIIICFSSTMVVLKLLSDRRELDNMRGRLSLGILLLQDIGVIIALALLMNIGNFTIGNLSYTFINCLAICAIGFILKKTLFPKLFKKIAKTPELMFLTALSVCFGFIALADIAGIPISIGAFIAGISLTAYPYDLQIISQVTSLKNFFATLFFVSLGLMITTLSILSNPILIVMLTFLVIFVKPFILLIITKSFGYDLRSSFLTAIGLGQISEFSLIIAAIGVSTGVVSSSFFSIVAIIALISLTTTPYFIQYGHNLFDKFSKYMIIFEKVGHGRMKKTLEKLPEEHLKDHIILAGYDIMGTGIYNELMKQGKKVIVLDYNPEVIDRLIENNQLTIYGDVKHVEILNRMNINKAKLVISTIPSLDDNMFLYNEVRHRNKTVPVMITVKTIEEALQAYDKGVDYVILPELLSREKITQNLQHILSSPESLRSHLERSKRKYVKTLEKEMEEKILAEYEPEYLKHLERTMDDKDIEKRIKMTNHSKD